MKSATIAILVIAVLILGAVLLVSNNSKQNPASVTPTPNASTFPSLSPAPTLSSSTCQPSDFSALIESEGAAGNIYDTLTIKNTSNKPCSIDGNNMLQVNYNAQAVRNIALINKGKPGPESITIAPGETIYSQAHYPNGPQCQGPVTPVPVTFTYQISNADTITFTDAQKNTSFTIQACSDQKDLTQVEVWNLSTSPISPQ